MLTLLGLGRMEEIPEGVLLPGALAQPLGRPPIGEIQDGQTYGFPGGPEPTSRHFRQIREAATARNIPVTIRWAEPLGSALLGEGAPVVEGGDLPLGGLLSGLPPGPFSPHDHGLFDPNERVLVFRDVRGGGERMAVRDLTGVELGPLSAIHRPVSRDMSPMLRVLTVMDALRGEGGCPWDREQTARSLRPYLIEEAAEAADAIDLGDPNKVREEMGDLLLQIAFHSRIGHEQGLFAFEDVATTLAEKLLRRHPHVFGEIRLEGGAAVLRQWDQIKRKESGGTRSLRDEVPKHLGALERVEKLLQILGRLEVTPPEVEGAGGEMLTVLERELKRKESPGIALREVGLRLAQGLFSIEEEAARLGSNAVDLPPEDRQIAFLKGFHVREE